MRWLSPCLAIILATLVSSAQAQFGELNWRTFEVPDFGTSIQAGENPTTYLRHNLRMKRSALGYVRIARSFFAISSEGDGVILYSRCNFSGGARGVIHCFDLKYPQQEKRSWDAVVTRISRSLRPLES